MKATTIFILLATCSLYSQGEDTLFVKYLPLRSTGVTYLGDQNSDGYDDILMYDCSNKKALIFFGGNPMDTIPDLEINQEFYSSIQTLDINHDGKLDIIASYLTPEEKVNIRVYYGGVLLDTIPDIEFTGPEGSKYAGARIYSLKDFDGDGNPELILEDIYAPNSNLQYGCLYFYTTYPQLDTIPFTYIAGDSANNIRLAPSISTGFSSGDINRDGMTDFDLHGYIVDTTGGNPEHFRRYYFGNENFELTPAVTFNEYEHTTFNPQYMQIIKDVNGDRKDDILIAYNGVPFPYYYWDAILYGSSPIDTVPDVGLNTQNNQINFQIPAVSIDYNQDGYNDFMVRAGYPEETRLWYGRHDMNLNGYELPKKRWGGDFSFFGRLFARVGDVNGDSIEDYCIGKSSTGPPLCVSGYIIIFKGDTLYKDTTTVDVEDITNLPVSFELYEPYPNPFNPSTVISWQSEILSQIKIIIYDALGKEVAVLLNEEKNAGEHEIVFDASKYNLTSGVYFIELKVSDKNKIIFSQTKKLSLIK